MTLEDILRRSTERLQQAGLFYGHGTDNAADEACYLISAVIGHEPVYNNFDPERRVTAEQATQIDSLISTRIQTRLPAAYLINRAWFAGLEFYIDATVLVPRSPIAELIEDGFQPWLADGARRVLDIGTGCGCIAIACAHYLEGVTVDAVDIDPAALAVARRNVEAHGLQDRVRLIQTNLYENIGSETYDLIVANPPYVSHEEMAELPDEYRHEPRHALRANDEGLAVAIEILHGAAAHLEPGGCLVLEVGYSWPALARRYPQAPFFWFEFERGGEGVCLLDRDTLRRFFGPGAISIGQI